MQKIFLLCLATGIIFASCEDNNELSETSDAVGVEMPERPIEDAMLVTTDFETKMYGMISEGFPSRLAARIKNPTPVYNDSTTRVCIVSDDAIKKNELTVDDYIDIYNCYEKGGIVIVTTPTVDGFNLKFQVEMALAAYYKYAIATNLQVDGKAPTPDQYMSQFLNVENVDEKALKDGVMYDAIGFTTNGIYYLENADTGKTIHIDGDGTDSKDEIIERKLTAYDYGCYADALVAWINEKDAPATRSGIGNVLNTGIEIRNSYWIEAPNIVNAQIGLQYCDNMVTEVINVNAIHDFGKDRDYYLINQDMTFLTSKIKPVPDPFTTDTWWKKSGILYMQYFDSWESEMELSVPNYDEPIPILDKFFPEASNGSTTESQSSTHGYTNTIGGSIGFSDISLNYSYSESYSFTTGYSRSVEDISVIHTSEDGANKWIYKANRPQMISKNGWKHWMAGNLLISDMTQTNSALYYVDSSPRKKTLSINNHFYYGLLLMHEPEKEIRLRTGFVRSYTIPPSLRSHQSWDFSFDMPEDLEKRVGSDEVVDRIWKKMETAMTDVYPGGPVSYKILDESDYSTANAQKLLYQISNQLKKIAKQYRYKGKFIVHLDREETDQHIQQEVVVE